MLRLLLLGRWRDGNGSKDRNRRGGSKNKRRCRDRDGATDRERRRGRCNNNRAESRNGSTRGSKMIERRGGG